MALTNAHNTYGSVSKTLHWLTVALILALIPLGIIANDMPFATGEELSRKAFVFSIHKTLGVTAFFVALARVAWMLSQPKPAPLHPERRLETFAAETVHWTLYATLLLVPMSGWIHHAATTGFAPIWWPFGQSLPFVPKSDTLAHTFASLHIIFERVLVIALVLHVAGALKHRFFDRDLTLQRMLPGATAAAPATPAKPHGPALPLLGAAGAFAAALAVSAGLGLFAHDDAALLPQAELAEVASDWTVEDGTLSITVTQLGAPVTGTFEDWTAAIAYDPDSRTGDVTVTVAIPSLTLGSVTAQALGAEFFAADTHPTATFAAEIIGTDAGQTAEGTLTLKGSTVPVTLPFTLNITDGLARMTGETQVARLDFGIGTAYPDETSVGFTVTIAVDLTARRTAP
ncbi:cytochrome b/b6 domain-containing protein [Dinoroseobacter sp. PD6]|uniref:cytochrome b/b6 domain-containing protein n=1 Tax=Dinoroseobacter sp. PD6 TaxID=3028384 RepID=UPI00237C3A91|nr:cytochrome b/b6 domain-containing protein [Dinoroseobacter sp. PD6]MDD9716565.1 cytochrome b/b6 domain-containing protein [Dinoroseobacter sp. PD6]